MWDEPYLETCCRAALHRLALSGEHGRPSDSKDGPCLQRLVGRSFAAWGEDERWRVTAAGRARHAEEVLRGDSVAAGL